jgi:hypothetical protein
MTPHFTIEEATLSQTASRLGLKNIPSDSVLSAIQSTAYRMEVVRRVLNAPIIISSWYRSPEVNAAVGGSKHSQHISGEAVDFICPVFGTPVEICTRLRSLVELINFDQLIYEHTWVHISWSSVPGATQKNQVLSLSKDGSYVNGIID